MITSSPLQLFIFMRPKTVLAAAVKLFVHFPAFPIQRQTGTGDDFGILLFLVDFERLDGNGP